MEHAAPEPDTTARAERRPARAVRELA